MDTRYLYGAAVQGIQSFIFQTNKMKDIVGASELIKSLCDEKFQELFKSKCLEYRESCCVLHAAGNIKYIFESRIDCEKIVREFPKLVAEYAPGITLSQAVVKLNENDFASAISLLESRLHEQRNKPLNALSVGLMGIKRSPQTGLPLVENDVDRATIAKRNAINNYQLCNDAFGKLNVTKGTCYGNIEKIPSKNDWIAVIHADGNGLGQVVRKIGGNKEDYSYFSSQLDAATKQAAKDAFEYIRDKFKWEGGIPIRPIVLGGDDFTAICRADFAIEYASKFIESFELRSREKIGVILEKVFTSGNVRDCLTACAGIVFVKSSFPFYFAYELAEKLCSEAKKDAKCNEAILAGTELPASCIMFHKVQGSFTDEWKTIKRRELTPQNNVSFVYGPYYIKPVGSEHEGKLTVDELLAIVEQLDAEEDHNLKSHVRTWISLLHDNPHLADQKRIRAKEIIAPKLRPLFEKMTFVYSDNEEFKSYAYDALAIHTVKYQQTMED